MLGLTKKVPGNINSGRMIVRQDPLGKPSVTPQGVRIVKFLSESLASCRSFQSCDIIKGEGESTITGYESSNIGRLMAVFGLASEGLVRPGKGG